MGPVFFEMLTTLMEVEVRQRTALSPKVLGLGKAGEPPPAKVKRLLQSAGPACTRAAGARRPRAGVFLGWGLSGRLMTNVL